MSFAKREGTSETGFTLVELLVSIVVVGVLTGVAIVGIAGLHDKGASAACNASRDAATAATLAYYSNFDGKYPQTFDDLATPPTGRSLFDASSATITSPTTLKGRDGWTLTLHTGVTVTDRTTFNC